MTFWVGLILVASLLPCTVLVSACKGRGLANTSLVGTTWTVDRVMLDGKSFEYGANRVRLQFEEGSVRILICDNAADSLFPDGNPATSKACEPPLKWQCFTTPTVSLTSNSITYQSRTVVPECVDQRRGPAVLHGDDCGVSPRPDLWPFLGSEESKIERGPTLTLTTTAGKATVHTASMVMHAAAPFSPTELSRCQGPGGPESR
jgi:hypothetical protein